MSSLASGIKRRRIEPTTMMEPVRKRHVSELLALGRWSEAMSMVKANPREANSDVDPSPLALACRLGAPFQCVQVILDASPHQLRRVLDARGTPIHEAIVCENVGTSVIEALLRADEGLEKTDPSSPRATLLQDVDGFTPLHLLIRRRFQAHILNDESANLMQILEMLVSSCPEAVLIPDRGEYEEPPIVYALKANIYAPALGSEDATLARIEREIYEMVSCMLKHCPSAASTIFTGYRGRYTALHSAVFHGRVTNTIELLLRTEAETNTSDCKNAVLANTQGELPLHFCAMRGERPRSVELIANTSPIAICKRDASGLTPVHWMWARFVSTLLALEGVNAGEENLIPLSFSLDTAVSPYCDFASLEQGDSDLDLQLIRRVDPPVDFLRMRHIPIEVLGPSDSVEWANRTSSILLQLRERFEKRDSMDVESRKPIIYTRRECVICLFWTKIVSLLLASQHATADRPRGHQTLVHTAFAVISFLPAVARIVATLYPEQLTIPDESGRLPIHYAARRSFHAWDWPRDDDCEKSAAALLLQNETLLKIRTVVELSPLKALHCADRSGRLVLHELIESFNKASQRYNSRELHMEMHKTLQTVVEKNPSALQRRDGKTKLFPFLEAAVFTTADAAHSSTASSVFPVSMAYQLLRENPSILSFCRPAA